MKHTEQISRLHNKCSEKYAEVKLLKKQLAEKDAEIERLNKIIKTLCHEEAIKHQWCMTCDTQVFKYEKQLEQAKSLLREWLDDAMMVNDVGLFDRTTEFLNEKGQGHVK